MDIAPYRSQVDAFERWLARSSSALKRWKQRLGNDPQGAVGEAMVWHFLTGHVDQIDLNEDPKSGGPDFLCNTNGVDFLVECTALTIKKATNMTGLSNDLRDAGGAYSDPLESVADKLNDKMDQLDGHDIPTLLVLCTFHLEYSAVAMRTFFVEQSLMSLYYNKEGDGSLVPARRNASAVLLLGFAVKPIVALGMIHPAPVHGFSALLLPEVQFCSLPNWPASVDGTTWSVSESDDKSN